MSQIVNKVKENDNGTVDGKAYTSDKNASVDSLKEYYKKVKPECILDGRKK